MRTHDQPADEQLLQRYLLGQVSEDERAHVEERFFSDSDYYQQLLIVEDELRCAYAKGSLQPGERDQFEKHFLVFPDERQKVELAGAMLAELSRMAVEEGPQPVAAPRTKGNPFEQLLALFDFRRPVMRFAAATAAVLVLVGFAWLAFQASRLRRQPDQLAAQQTASDPKNDQRSVAERSRIEQLNKDLENKRTKSRQQGENLATQRKQTPKVDQPAGAILSLLLAPGRIRGGGEAKKVVINKDAAGVRLLLSLGEKSGYQSYRASILNSDGAPVLSRGELRARRTAGSQVVILNIPPRLLAQDDYEIDLQGLTVAGELERVGDYYFTVLKR